MSREAAMAAAVEQVSEAIMNVFNDGDAWEAEESAEMYDEVASFCTNWATTIREEI